jgi:hypothetical protein
MKLKAKIMPFFRGIGDRVRAGGGNLIKGKN